MKTSKEIHPLLFFVAAVIFGCSQPQNPEPESDFSVISGSGYVYLNLRGLNTDYAGDVIMYGASGIPMGGYERTGNASSVDSDNIMLTISVPAQDVLFPGGTVLDFCGAIIDTNANLEPDDGDLIVERRTFTVDGNVVGTFDWPADFETVSGCGNADFRFTGINSAFPGATVIYGVSGVEAGGYERGGDLLVAGSDDILADLLIEGNDVLFTGGTSIGVAGAVIDVNGNLAVDNGDYIARIFDTTVNGDTVFQFDWPADFSMISNSGTLTLTFNGLYDDFAGMDLMYGVSGIEFGPLERLGETVTIDSNSISVVIQYDDGGTLYDYPFPGGTAAKLAGAIVDVNGNMLIDDGDYLAIHEIVVINGDTEIEFNN